MNLKNKKGFSLIEVLIVVFIMLVVFTSFYSVSTIGTRYIIESKNRLGAVAFVNEKMEIVRNLKYEDVGIQGGIPNGNIPEEEDVMANGRTFHVRTVVQYIDDSLDGLVDDTIPDIIPNDYKVVKIIVSWNDSAGTTQQVSSLSRFVPPGLETSIGGAPLAINVKGSDGSPVKQASVNIVNSAVMPNLNFTLQTDDTGHIMIPAAPASVDGYQITVTKNNHETVSTLDSPSKDHLNVDYIPTYAHFGVLIGALNTKDYIQDKLAKLTVKTVDYQNKPIGNIPFTIVGGKVLGRHVDNSDVFTMNGNGTTDATTGLVEYASINPGNYRIELAPSVQYEFVEFFPTASPVALVPEGDLVHEIRAVDVDVDGLLATVLDDETNMPLLDAKISLKDSADADVFSDMPVSVNGIAYYPNSTTPLLAGTYTLKVEAVGYATQDISVTINKLTKQEVKLVKN